MRSTTSLQKVSCFLSLLSLISLVGSISVESGSLRTDGLVNPLGTGNSNPRFSWRPDSTIRNDKQTAYQIQVASTENRINTPDLWDSGIVRSGDVAATYTGHGLTSRSAGVWRVRIWDAWGQASDWSEVASFELALLAASDWKGEWIYNADYEPFGKTSIPVFGKTFSVSCPVSKARLYILGMGQYGAYLNGQRISDAVLTPGYSDTNSTLPYNTFDIASLLNQGSNFFGVEMGKGVYDAEQPIDKRYTDFITAPNPLAVISQLEITCANGQTTTVVSDTTWKSSASGPLIESAWYGGEEYNAQQEIPGWPTGNTITSNWTNASPTTLPVSGALTADPGPHLIIFDSFPAVSVNQINDSCVFDFGVNFAGWYNLTFHGDAGSRVTIYPAEELLPSGLMTQTSTSGPIFEGYTFAGKESEHYAPKFMYHGFRYIQVNGLNYTPSASDITGLVIRAENDAVGAFETSNTLFNSIHKIIDRSIQSNMYSVLTDCPHREKSGWLEQDHLVFDPVAWSYDILAHSKRFLQIIAASQLTSGDQSGMIPTTAPEFKVFLPPYGIYRDEPNWGNTLMVMALQLYRTYGESDFLETYYPNMVAYMNYLATKTNGTYTLDYGLGDWETEDGSTPLGITSTLGYQQAAISMYQIATILSKSEDAQSYYTLNSNILKAFHTKFFNYNSTSPSYGSGSQASNAIALDIGAVPSQHYDAVLTNLIASCWVDEPGTGYSWHFTVGEIGLPSLIRALQAGGRDDVIFNLMSQTTNVSYGYQVMQGATSLWEHWDGVSGSLNHYMFGYGDTWLRTLAGAQQTNTSVAWEELKFRPVVVGDLTSASSSFRSVRGWVNASWVLEGGTLSYDVTVPVGSTATVYLNSSQITESGQDVKNVGDMSWRQWGDQAGMVEIGSGSYSFRAEDYGTA